MRFRAFLGLLVLPLLPLRAQDDIRLRSTPEEALYPFVHGVASGDPLTDRVILWTRLSTEEPGPWFVRWQVAEDTAFTVVVAQGTTATGPERDFTVKVDATGLEPDHWYYYRFQFRGRPSLTGRTRTLPNGPLDALRLAVFSCACYQCGYFNPYERITERNDVDLVVHLGDYLYEYPAFGYGYSSFVDRVDEPAGEPVTLEAYRIRHGWYKLDPQSRAVHQQFPFLITYDDHETANDSWRDGAQNHTDATEGPWRDRQRAGYRAWLEWMPVRDPDSLRSYRRIPAGPLVDFFVLDTRLYRDRQDATAIDDPARGILGRRQYRWLVSELAASTATWKVLLNQVMMAPLLNGAGTPLYADQWDGYRAERTRLFDTLDRLGIENLLVLTGDIHSAWISELPHYRDRDTVSVGVECICTSTSALDRGISTWSPIAVYAFNPHIRYAKTSGRGYLTVDLNASRAQCDQWGMTALTRNTAETPLTHWTVPEGEARAVAAIGPAVAARVYPTPAPPRPFRSCGVPADPRWAALAPDSALLAWGPVPDASAYRVEGGPEGGLYRQRHTPDTALAAAPLLPGTAYQWRVQSLCPGGGVSPWSGWRFFSTPEGIGASREGAPPAWGSGGGTAHCLGAYPNPFHDALAVKVHLTAPGHLAAELLDAGGRSVWRADLGVQPDGLLLRRLEGLGGLPAGTYRLRLWLDGSAAGGWTVTKP